MVLWCSDERGGAGNIFFSTLPFPRADEHLDIYLKLPATNTCRYGAHALYFKGSLTFGILLSVAAEFVDKQDNIRL